MTSCELIDVCLIVPRVRWFGERQRDPEQGAALSVDYGTPVQISEPVAAFNVNVDPVLFSVPVRFTTPPAREIVPIPAVVLKVPPRLTVLMELLSICTEPPLVHAFAETVTSAGQVICGGWPGTITSC